MEKELKAPKLRFPGFTDDWEQRKLGNIANFINGRAYSQSELQDSGKYKILRVGNFYTNDSWYYSDMELDEKFYANKGDLLYTWSATFGPHIWDGDKVIYHYHIWKIELANSIDKTFAIQLLEKDKANILSNTNGSTMIHITKAGMEEKIVTIPAQIEEQMKIGSFLDKLDNLITLHQRKLDTLKKLKKGFLQKMFPKNGESVPEIRFPGFTDAWEQRKLSELATMHARIGWQNLRTSEFLDSGDYMLITGTDFEDGKVNYSTCHYVEKERYEQDKNIQIKNGSILITKDGTLGKVAYVEGLSMPATLNAGVFNVEVRDENETDRKYLFQFLKAPFLMDYVAQKATGGTIKHLNQNILVDFPIAMPSKAEQIRIGEYFTNIDNLITLHQRMCICVN